MPVIHKLDGLIAWTRCPEWREIMAETLLRHVAKACTGADLEIEELSDVLDDAAQWVIWGAAFEDLLASDLPDGRNLADDYLKRRGWKDPVATQEYIAALRRSVISLYEVSEVVPGESMLLRDLVRSSEPVRVLEKSGTRSLRQWDRVATRVISQRSGTVISGTLLPYDQATSEQLLALLRRVRSKAGGLVAEVAREVGRAVSADAADAALTPELLLGRTAFAFTNLWLAAVLRAELDDTPPEVANSDGDPLHFVTLHFPLRSGVTLAAARAALDGIRALDRAGPSFWNWLAAPAKPPKRVPQKPDGVQLITTMEGGAVVLGTVEISGRKVILSVNSEARAEPAVESLVQPRLADRHDHYTANGGAASEWRAAPSFEPAARRGTGHLAAAWRALPADSRSANSFSRRQVAPRGGEDAERVGKSRAWLKTLENHLAKRPAGELSVEAPPVRT
ncbi:hypothetical protein [Muricoccus vinaceus]|uniref:DUF2397 family protein n=1 Tax=Muricoccus vinaceus TaxID=424704 RepID=A0ABV6IT83_9PROT